MERQVQQGASVVIKLLEVESWKHYALRLGIEGVRIHALSISRSSSASGTGSGA
jgi:hypothetical protein